MKNTNYKRKMNQKIPEEEYLITNCKKIGFKEDVEEFNGVYPRFFNIFGKPENINLIFRLDSVQICIVDQNQESLEDSILFSSILFYEFHSSENIIKNIKFLVEVLSKPKLNIVDFTLREKPE